MRRISAAAGLLLLVLAALGAGGETTPSAAPIAAAPALRISAGDLLDVSVFDTPELSSKIRVDHDGNITLPVGGELQVKDLTAEEAAAAVQKRLLDKDIIKDPHVSVFILEYATQGVTVLGEVKTPGVYPVLGARSLFDFISAAGGLTPTAANTAAIMHRGQPGKQDVVRLSNDPAKAAAANLPIEPGDTILVPRAGIVYVVGDVGKPGGFLIDNNERLSVLQAVALAAGTNRTAALNNSKLIRKSVTGREEIPLPLKKILQNKSADMTLNDGDILFVPSSTAKSIGWSSVQSAVNAAGLAAIYH
ncbi:MAG: polysaccharide biosynthesis/export family protein [Terriglobales bacterium]